MLSIGDSDGWSKKGGKRKKSANSPETSSEQSKQKKMTTPSACSSPPPSQQQCPQGSQFSYLQMLQPNYNMNQQGYGMNNGVSSGNGMIGLNNCMSPPLMPQNPVQSVPLSSPDLLNKIFTRLECIDSKLVRLDSIEKSVSDISTKVKSMDEKVMALENKIGNIEQSREFDSRSMDEMRGRHNEMDKMLKEIRKSQKALSDGENKVKEQLVDLKCREMRDNLLFYNVDEERGETDDACMEKVLGIIEDEMRIENARRDVRLHRAHRIGRFINGKTRPIVAKFVLYPDRERVRKAGSVLREANSKYGVSQQFPKEIQDRRKALVPIMKQARNEGKDAYIVVDKLYIDKVLYRGPACPPQNMNLGGAAIADTAGASMETETGHGENT